MPSDRSAEMRWTQRPSGRIAPQGLAVHGDGRPRREDCRRVGPASVGAIGEPGAERPVEGVAVEALQYAAHGGLTGRVVGVMRIAQRGAAVKEHPVGGVGGPFGDRRDGLRASQDDAGGQGEDEGQGVAPALAAPRVGQLGESVQQAGKVLEGRRPGAGELAQESGDG